jgi:outer membrane protein OmpA-like peptidoglycan-associated protein
MNTEILLNPLNTDEEAVPQYPYYFLECTCTQHRKKRYTVAKALTVAALICAPAQLFDIKWQDILGASKSMATFVLDYVKEQPLISVSSLEASGTPPLVGEALTPVQVEEARAMQPSNFVLLDGIYFAHGSSTMRCGTGYSNSVDVIAEIMKDGRCATLDITGHTDLTGTKANNDPLSLARAESVKTELVALGVAASKLTTAGVGSDKPLTPESGDVPRNRYVSVLCR